MRPIDADKLREEWVNHLHIPNPDSYFAVQQEISSECIGDFIQSIDEQPTVEPVKHGYWITTHHEMGGVIKRNVYLTCSECKGKSVEATAFCSSCGAKMQRRLD